jgi:hypothetical protein
VGQDIDDGSSRKIYLLLFSGQSVVCYVGRLSLNSVDPGVDELACCMEKRQAGPIADEELTYI